MTPIIPGYPDPKRYYAVGFCPAPGVSRLAYALQMKSSWLAEQFNLLLAQNALPAGLIVLCPRVGTFVVTGDEATTRKALKHFWNSYQGPLWWPLN